MPITVTWDVMTVLNNMDRFNLVIDVIDRVPKLAQKAAHAKQAMQAKLTEHRLHIHEAGEDMQEIREWLWLEN